jgi:integrase
VQQKAGRWYATVTLPGGKRRTVPCPERVNTEAWAKEYAAHVVERVRLGTFFETPAPEPAPAPPPPEPQGETFAAWCERWLTARTARGLKSVADDRGRLKNHVWPFDVVKKPMVAITPDDLETVRDSLDKRVQAGEMAWKQAVNVWGIVTVAFHDASQGKNRSLRVLKSNPALGLEGPDRGAKPGRQYLYPSEAERLLAGAETPDRWALLFALAIYTGLRAGELEALTWADVDLEHGVLSVTKAVNRKTGKVETTKTEEHRRLPIEAPLRPLLLRLRRPDADAERVTWMPPDEDRAPGLRRYLERVGVKRAGLLEDTQTTRRITFHDLRGTYLTWCAVRGDPPLVIMQRAGHAQFATTEGYIREAEALRQGFGVPFPALPGRLTGAVSTGGG